MVAPMEVRAVKTRIFEQDENLEAFALAHIPALTEGSIFVVASKIVALAEGRVVGTANEEELIRQESEWQRHIFGSWWLTVRDGTVVVNAGIDASNVNPVKDVKSQAITSHGAGGTLILLPKDSFGAAQRLREALRRQFALRALGVIITDSRITPLRAGVQGVALGYAGFKGVRDYRGSSDLFGRPMEVTQINIADSLATAATLLMGEGNECQPLAIIENAPVDWVDEVDRNELKMPREQDMFKHLFE